MKILLSVLVAFLLNSCAYQSIHVRTEYLDRNYLASEQINTPDPLKACFLGQKAIVTWHLPNQYFRADNLTMVFQVRYGNFEVETLRIPVCYAHGTWVYEIINEEYCSKKGMSAYKVQIFDGETQIACWQHHVWADVIEINTD